MHALLDGIPLDQMNTSMTINATAAWLLALYIVTAEENGIGPDVLQGTTQNDIIKEYLSRGTYAFPPAPEPAADRGHGRLHGRARPEVEPDQHLLLPPAGGRGDPGAGDRLRALDRDRGARRGAGTRPAGAHGRGLRPDLLLRQRRRALRRGARQAARDGRAVGRARPRALRRRGPQAPPLPLRRAGQQPRPDGVPAREQRPADRARGARRHARPRRPRPRDPAPGLERGARPPAPVGPAVVAAHPAGARLRDRPARVPRHLRGLQGDGGPRRRAQGGRPRGDGARRRARRRRRRGRLHEGRAGGLPPRAAGPDRGRRAGAGRRQPLPGDRAVPADGRRRGRHPRGRRRRRAGGAGRARRVARAARRGRGRPPRWRSSPAWPPPTRT